MTWKQGKDGTLQQMSGTEADSILELGSNGLRWKTDALPYWVWVDSDAHYLACQYNYTTAIGAGTNASVEVSNDTENKTLTIKAGEATGTVYVKAYTESNTYATPWYYGDDYGDAGRQIKVIVYDSADPTKIPFTVTNLGTVNLTEDETYEINEEALRELNFLPESVSKAGFTMAAAIPTSVGVSGTTYPASNAYVKVSNDTGKFTVTGLDNSGITGYEVAFFALPTADTSINGTYKIARLFVEVAPAAALTSIDSAAVQVDEPMVAATVGDARTTETELNYTIDWTEWTDNGGSRSTSFDLGKTYTVSVKLTAKAGYTFASGANFTVNGKKATTDPTTFTGGTSVTVTYTFTMPVHIHASPGIWYRNGTNHWQTCDTCGEVIQSTNNAHRITWVTDKVATETEKGSKHKECMFCGYRTGEKQEIPASGTAGTPTDPTPGGNNPDTPNKPNNPNNSNLPDSSSGGYHSGAVRPYRPDLSTVVPESTIAAKPNSTVQSPGTGDAGIVLYAALSMLSMTGGAWLVSKKRREK